MTATTAVAGQAGERVLDPGRAARHAFVVLLLRDIRVLRRNFGNFLARTVMQPLLFTFVFAYVFPKIGQGVGTPRGATGDGALTFATVLVPGLLAASVIFQGIQAVALPLVQEFSFTKEIEDRVLAPMPVGLVGLGKIVSGAVQAIVAAVVVFPVVMVVHAKGEAPSVHIDNWPVFLAVLVLSSLLSASFGMLIGTSFAPQNVPLVFAIIVLPLNLLGGIYYPWAALDPIPWLKYSVLVNPLVYMSEGFRAALTPSVEHMPPAVFLTVMAAITALLMRVSLARFRRRVVS